MSLKEDGQAAAFISASQHSLVIVVHYNSTPSLLEENGEISHPALPEKLPGRGVSAPAQIVLPSYSCNQLRVTTVEMQLTRDIH